MSATDDVPRIALVGWSPAGASLLSARAVEVLAAADTVLCSGELEGFARDSRARTAPDDAREIAAELARIARDGARGVWLGDGDPLDGVTAGWLTALAGAWEYVPPAAFDPARAGAVAHVARRALAAPERFPLLGLVVAVTRAESQSGFLISALAAAGADAVACPTIEIADPEDAAPLDAALGRLDAYDWAVFTSANGVHRFFARMRETGGDVRELKGVRLAAIGPATATALVARGLRVDLVPDAYVAESLVDALRAATPLDGQRFLVARAAVARDVLPDALRAAGALVDVAEAYRTVRPRASADLLAALLEAGRLDLVTFTSSSTVTNFVELVGADRAKTARAACIGPVTAATARAAGLDVAVEATEFTAAGLVSAILRWRGAA